ncbi:hypothetical protein JCM4914_44670 [Streptomyces platensis subsp. malvinus]
MGGGLGLGDGVDAGGVRGLGDLAHVRSSCPLDKVFGNGSSLPQWTPFRGAMQQVFDGIGPDLADGRKITPTPRPALYLSSQSFTF